MAAPHAPSQAQGSKLGSERGELGSDSVRGRVLRVFSARTCTKPTHRPAQNQEGTNRCFRDGPENGHFRGPFSTGYYKIVPPRRDLGGVRFPFRATHAPIGSVGDFLSIKMPPYAAPTIYRSKLRRKCGPHQMGTRQNLTNFGLSDHRDEALHVSLLSWRHHVINTIRIG